ncbi:MAG: hypothetical protein V1854_04900 [Methanobacteriota archaeon]
MDLTKQFIEMCEKAVEIQDSYRSRIPAADDIFVGKLYHGAVMFVQLSPTNILVTNDYIWIPRQNQLQEMVFEKTAVSLACRFKDFIARPLFDKNAPYKFTPEYSMEQLWLSFVMYTLYKKCWDSDKKEWVE